MHRQTHHQTQVQPVVMKHHTTHDLHTLLWTPVTRKMAGLCVDPRAQRSGVDHPLAVHVVRPWKLHGGNRHHDGGNAAPVGGGGPRGLGRHRTGVGGVASEEEEVQRILGQVAGGRS